MIGFLLVFTLTAYFVRGLQLLFGTSKRAVTERAEEMGNEDDDIPLTQRSRTVSEVTPSQYSPNEESPERLADIIAPAPTQDPTSVRVTGGPPANAASAEIPVQQHFIQDPVPLTRAQKWAAILTARIDTFTYFAIFLFIGIPVYYGIDYAMPIQLSLSILAYFAALAIPPTYKRFLHPVLVCSAITILGIWILALIRGDSLDDGLKAYKTKTRYLQLWEGEKHLPKPGAGDVFSTVLDVSIVALALPMFQYRMELKRHVSLLPFVNT